MIFLGVARDSISWLNIERPLLVRDRPGILLELRNLASGRFLIQSFHRIILQKEKIFGGS